MFACTDAAIRSWHERHDALLENAIKANSIELLFSSSARLADQARWRAPSTIKLPVCFKLIYYEGSPCGALATVRGSSFLDFRNSCTTKPIEVENTVPPTAAKMENR